MDEEKKSEQPKKKPNRRERNAINKMQMLLIAGFILIVIAVIVLVGYTVLNAEGIGVAQGRYVASAVRETEQGTQLETTPPVTTPEPTSEPAPPTLQEKAAAQLETMTTEEKVYQLLLATPYSLTQTVGLTEASEGLLSVLAEQPVGGLIFTDANINAAEDVTEMIAAVREAAALAPFFGADPDGSAKLQAIGAENTAALGMTKALLVPEISELYFKMPPFENNLLEARVDFSGVILTEDFSYQYDALAVDALVLGFDMIFKPANPKLAADAILQAIEDGILTEQRIDESVLRILIVKYELGILD